ncbi:MAG: leucine dehydrogenase [Myxococcales bacterium]|nr:leucine dehydrogenase [Myxococcales bacterium]
MIASRGHEQAVFCHDPVTGLRAIVAIHDTTLGPALGGTRMWTYDDDGAALEDALRLARGMTYKSAAAGLNLGGGKAVIIGNSKTDKDEMLFRSYGRFIQGLAGRYITAEDVGTSVQDMEWVRMETDFVVGISRSLGGSGDPSPFTALGVCQGIRAALKWQTGSDDLAGKTVSVQGVGHVGYHLVKQVTRAGGRVVVADIDADNLRRVSNDFDGVEVVDPSTIYDVDCDIYAPCALGAVINDDTLPRLKCSIVAGSANNVLAEDRHGSALAERGVLYAPDYVVNAGGLMNVANELEGYNTDRATQQVQGIYDITTEIFQIARDEGIPTAQAADALAERRIAAVARVKATHVPTPLNRRRR